MLRYFILCSTSYASTHVQHKTNEIYFDVNESMNVSRENISEDVVAPIDLPYMLTGSDLNIELVDTVTVEIEDESLHMLVYKGENNFTVIEKVSSVYDEIEVIESNGDIALTINGFVRLEDSKVSYNYNGVDIVIYGDSLDAGAYLNIVNGMEVSTSK